MRFIFIFILYLRAVMNYIDIIITIILLWAAYKGFSKGFVIQAAALVALLLGIYGAIRFSDFTSVLLIEKFDLTTKHLKLISFIITFVVIVIAVQLLANLLDKLIKAVALGFVNRLAGLFFSVLKAAFIVSILLVVINTLDKRYSFLPEKEVNESVFYSPLSNFAPMIFPYFKDNFESIRKPEDDSPPKNLTLLRMH